jgi:hypothetical protein
VPPDTTPTEVATIAHAIQLAVAPVFLLSGIGVLLGVLTNRLARVVDRARPLEERHFVADPAEAEELRQQLLTLAHRARLMNRAITLSTISALFVSIVVALLFGSALIHFNLALPVAGLFILAMIALVGALLSFLLEVRVATRSIRIGPRDR